MMADYALYDDWMHAHLNTGLQKTIEKDIWVHA